MIRAVICDIYGTLLEVGPPPPDAEERWARLWQETVGTPDPPSLAQLDTAVGRLVPVHHAAGRARGLQQPEIDWPALAAEAFPALERVPAPQRPWFYHQHAGLCRTTRLAPEAADCLEDWIRLPASQDDIDARCRAIAARAMLHSSETPGLDPDGVLRVGAGWVSLPPLEARLMSALLDRFGAVVSRDNLSRSGWPTGAPGRNALDVHMLRLRRRIAPLGLAIRTVRSRGYLLEAGDLQIVQPA